MQFISLIKQAWKQLIQLPADKSLSEFCAENTIGKSQFYSYLALQNGFRMLLFSIPCLILSFIDICLKLNLHFQNMTTILGNVVLFLLSLCTLILFSISWNQMERKKVFSKFNIFYWSTFSFGVILRTISENNLGQGRSAFLFLIILCAVPLFNFKYSAIIISVFMTALTAMCIMNRQILLLVLLLLSGVLSLFISVCIYNLTAIRYINQKKIQTGRERMKIVERNDKQTGLLNKISGIEAIEALLKNQKPVSIIIVDLDLFREYNCIKGTELSDRSLYDICSCIRIMSKEKTDIVCRYSGDRIMLGMSAETIKEVVEFAETIRESIQRMAIDFAENQDFGVLTVSVGISELCKNENFKVLFSQAEASLNIAKKEGRNCVGYKNHAFKTY